MEKVYIASQSGGRSSWGNGTSSFNVAANAGNVQKIAAAAVGMLCRAIVVTTGTAAASPGLLFYSGTAATAANLIGAIPGNAAVGTSYTFMMPYTDGVFVSQPANGPVVTVSYDA